jgi:hypothetical protein
MDRTAMSPIFIAIFVVAQPGRPDENRIDFFEK